MLPSIGFMEMIVLALLAIIVVGPEDLPKLMRRMGQFMARVRSMAQEFKDAFNEMGDATEMAELRKEIEELKQMGKLSNLTDDQLEDDLRDLDNELRDGVLGDSPKTPVKPRSSKKAPPEAEGEVS